MHALSLSLSNSGIDLELGLTAPAGDTQTQTGFVHTDGIIADAITPGKCGRLYVRGRRELGCAKMRCGLKALRPFSSLGKCE